MELIKVIILLIGLGNPGAQYTFNRHNIGFMALDAIANHYDFPAFTQKFDGEITEKKFGATKVILFKPMTYMNRSGGPASQLMRFYKILPEQVYVIHDELDLVPGKFKLKKGGGDGGHNGIKSLDACIGKNYWRIRLGIGRPAYSGQVSSYVLGDFGKEDEAWLSSLLTALGSSLENLLHKDHAFWQTKVYEEMRELGG